MKYFFCLYCKHPVVLTASGWMHQDSGLQRVCGRGPDWDIATPIPAEAMSLGFLEEIDEMLRDL